MSWSPDGKRIAFTVRSDGEEAPRAPHALWVGEVVRSDLVARDQACQSLTTFETTARCVCIEILQRTIA